MNPTILTAILFFARRPFSRPVHDGVLLLVIILAVVAIVVLLNRKQ
jgi:hypothetical protein